MEEEILFEGHPAMFRNRPFLFIILLAGILAYGLGLLFLLFWYIKVKAVKLKVTDKRILLKRGILSKNTNEINIKDIRNIQTNQTFFQRIFGVGTISISSAGTGGIEIKVSGIKKPNKLREMIREKGL